MKLPQVHSRTLASVGVALTVLVLAVTGALDVVNRAFLDFSLRLQAPALRPPEDGVLVLIDEPSLDYMQRTYNQRWPWSRDVFAALLLAINQAGAKQTVVDLMFLENSDRTELDDLLGSYAAACRGVILAVLPPRHTTPIFWPRDFLETHSGLNLRERIGHAEYHADPDGVVRHYPWAGSLAERAAHSHADKQNVLLRWYGGKNALPPSQVLSAQPFLEAGYGPSGLLSQMRALKVDEYDPNALRTAFQRLPAIARGSLRGKTVFIGTNAAGTFDVKAVPVSRVEPGVLVHFTAWANAKQNAFIPEFDRIGHFSLSAALALVLAWTITHWGWSRPNVRVLTITTALGTLALFCLSYFILPLLYFPPFAPVTALVLALIVLTIRHWVEETRRKREVQDIFGSYVSPTVVKRLMEDPDSLKLGGEKKELTVYFSDLAGFTDMSETMAPEPLMRLVNLYLSEMSEFILEEHGYLDKYIGDAIMGVFGSPEELPNHALAACRAALRSRDHLLALNQRLLVEEGRTLHARIGINTGDMTVGNVGSGRKRNYTVVGDPVNLASRLEGANKQFGTTILLGMRTQELARSSIVTRPVELLRVKGKQQPIQTYELLALKSEASAQVLEISSLFENAYHLYQQRDFNAAVVLFEKVRGRHVEDKLSQIYIDRCRQFQKEPPGPDWDGVFVMKDK
ncbi:MAG: hypothetical protein B9S32_15855 [Verrucomicrobia bacterium Tous-C9LFEB]|nr:MAG: hypothetical protein B9S32_15855 [Verrucomicrobia bacterium Tous-C9LFEB]